MSDASSIELVQEARSELGARESRDVDWVRDRPWPVRPHRGRGAARRTRGVAAGPGGRWSLVVEGPRRCGRSRGARCQRARSGRPVAVQAVAETETAAGSVVAIQGDGQVLVGGKPAAVGLVLRSGDTLDTRASRTTVDRPGKLTFVAERTSRATVTHVRGGLVLALEAGAVEAQVVPVATGEAFAVDVGPARVAVHGTHLRVSRAGERVTVDLNEGVVSVGMAPRRGSTLGTLVTAPAHVEFVASDAEGTLQVSHDPAAVRPPVALGATAQAGPPPAGASDGHPASTDTRRHDRFLAGASPRPPRRHAATAPAAGGRARRSRPNRIPRPRSRRPCARASPSDRTRTTSPSC